VCFWFNAMASFSADTERLFGRLQNDRSACQASPASRRARAQQRVL